MKIKKTICVIDHSDFGYVAMELTRFYEKVYYCYTDWRSAFLEPSAKKMFTGFPDVEVIPSIDGYKDLIDTFFFTDIAFQDLSEALKEEGRHVWNSGQTEQLEIDRKVFIDSLKEAGLPVPETDFCETIEELEKYLKGKSDLYVKISGFRGIRETFPYIDDTHAASTLNAIKAKVGCFDGDKDINYAIQKPIPTKYEWGTESVVVKGKFNENCFMGFEQKGCSYFTRFMPMSDLPKDMLEVHSKYEKVLERTDYTGNFSNEVRTGEDGKQYFIDITPRMGFPCSATYFAMGDNWGDVIEGSFEGKNIPLKSKVKYGCETIIMTSCHDEYNALSFDEKYKDNIKPCVSAMRSGVIFRLPNNQLYNVSEKLCTVVTTGNDIEKIIKENSEICANIKETGVSYDCAMLTCFKKNIEDLKTETGIKF